METGAAAPVGPEANESAAPAKAAPAPRPRSGARSLGATGAATRTLLILGGVILLVGSLAVAFGEPRVPATASGKPVPPRPQPAARRSISSWDNGIPLAPAKRERARRRAGISPPESSAV